MEQTLTFTKTELKKAWVLWFEDVDKENGEDWTGTIEENAKEATGILLDYLYKTD